MTTDDLPGWTIRARPVKSTALGLAVIMATFTVYNVLNVGIFRESKLGDVIAVLAFTAFVFLVAGWWFRSPTLVRYGLAGATFVYLTRTLFLLFSNPGIEGVWIGLGVSIIAAGAYLKETMHPHPVPGNGA